MQTDLLNILLGFIEGFALIISPCILPILPIILTGSLEGSKKRPVGLIIGFVLTFALFTFFSRKLVQYTGVDLTLVRHISYALLIIFGIVMMSSYLTEKFNILTARLLSVGSSFKSIQNTEGGFLSGLLFGSLVAVIWTPCAGPILASVIVQTVIQQTTLTSFLVVLAFGVGAALPMFIIAFFGREIMGRMGLFRKHPGVFRKILGAIIIAAVVFMIWSERVTLNTPSFAKSDIKQNMIVNGLMEPYSAPNFEWISDWINSPPLTIQQLRGKVVLVDFWTYSCINCVRSIPYLNEWYRKYKSQGFEIIGVHAPEFQFEHDFNNVKNAVLQYKIQYPVALDNRFVTWQNYKNRYWPAHYLIDKNGNVVYQHFGEGEYDVTENNIRYLLGMNATNETAEFEQMDFHNQTPETYLGYARMARFISPENVIHDQMVQYSFPPEIHLNQWALQGIFRIEAEKIISGGKAAIKIHFNAKKVFVVMGNQTGKPIVVRLLLNGESLIQSKGKDVVNGTITVKEHGLYEVLSFNQIDDGILQLNIEGSGLEVYTFTFG